jgi:hypothetical protein
MYKPIICEVALLTTTIGLMAVGVICRIIPIPQPPHALSRSAAVWKVWAVSAKPLNKKD